MNELEKEFFAFLDTRKQQTLEEASALASDSRKDESKEKIWQNKVQLHYLSVWRTNPEFSIAEGARWKLS